MTSICRGAVAMSPSAWDRFGRARKRWWDRMSMPRRTYGITASSTMRFISAVRMRTVSNPGAGCGVPGGAPPRSGSPAPVPSGSGRAAPPIPTAANGCRSSVPLHPRTSSPSRRGARPRGDERRFPRIRVIDVRSPRHGESLIVGQCQILGQFESPVPQTRVEEEHLPARLPLVGIVRRRGRPDREETGIPVGRDLPASSS